MSFYFALYAVLTRVVQWPVDKADTRSCTAVYFGCTRAGRIQLWIRLGHCLDVYKDEEIMPAVEYMSKYRFYCVFNL